MQQLQMEQKNLSHDEADEDCKKVDFVQVGILTSLLLIDTQKDFGFKPCVELKKSSVHGLVYSQHKI